MGLFVDLNSANLIKFDTPSFYIEFDGIERDTITPKVQDL